MKITIYELLGLIKDGKAPKKIRIRDTYTCNLTYDEKVKDYDVNGKYYMLKDMISYRTPDDFLNDLVEIIEEVEDKEYENIEEIEHQYIYGLTENEEKIDDRVSKQEEVINTLIRNQKKIIERLDK